MLAALSGTGVFLKGLITGLREDVTKAREEFAKSLEKVCDTNIQTHQLLVADCKSDKAQLVEALKNSVPK